MYHNHYTFYQANNGKHTRRDELGIILPPHSHIVWILKSSQRASEMKVTQDTL